MTFSRSFLLLLTLILSISAHGQMTTATLSPTEDTYVESGSTADNSAGTDLYADITATSIRRSYLKFDIASLNIPTNAVIYTAYLKMPIQTEYSVPATITAKRVSAAWNASTITYATQPALETSDASNVSDVTDNYRRIRVTSQVQKLANMPLLDNGFCVHRYNETGSARLYQYHSNENAGTKPVLEISYYVPFYVNSSTTVQHASTVLATDGAIFPQISGGSGETPSYQWYDSSGTAISGATSLALSGVGYGWYGLGVSSAIGDPVYTAFLVGVNCAEVDISFSPGPLYINDALVYERNNGTFDYGQFNYGTNTRIRAENQFDPDWYSQRAIMQFNLWVAPELDVIQSDLYLSRQSHYIVERPNTSELLMVTQPWLENTVTHKMGITTTTLNRIELPGSVSSAEPGIFDLKNYWDYWKQDNTKNYGLLLQLLTYDNLTFCRRSYNSSDATDGSVLPYINFKLSLAAEKSDMIAYNYFDALGTGWDYTVGTPTYTGTGTSGVDVTGIKTISGNKVMAKSYSTYNSNGQRASTNTITFANIPGLDAYDEVDFDFDLGSLGTTADAGVDAGEDFLLEVSTDNGTSWTSVLTAAGGSNLLFDLAASPVTALNIESPHAWVNGESHYKLRLEGVSQFKFRFTATNNRANENWVLDNITLNGISFPLSSEWDAATQTGSITFNYENKCTAVGPYNYFISELPIPSMKDSYHHLKDSIYGGVLDSASFFLGTEANLQYTFTDLPMAHYYVSVFDSRGELVYAGEKSLYPPLTMASSTGMEVHGNQLTATATNAKAVLEIYADETTRGGMEIQVQGITGTQSYGFIAIDDELSVLKTPTITDQVGISVSGGTITRTASGSSWGNAGGASVETILQGGYFEWTLGGTTSENRNIMVGLSYTNTDSHFNTIDYSWYTYTSGVNVYVGGNLPAGHVNGQYPGLALGDVLKIERKENHILFYQNNVLLYTAADSHPLTPMIVDFALVAADRKIYDLKIKRSKDYVAVTEFTGYTQFEEGFHLIDEKVYTVKKGVLSSSYETAAPGSRLQIMYGEGIVNYLLDGTVIDTETPPGVFQREFGAKKSIKGALKLIPMRLNLFKFYIFSSGVSNGACDDASGSFTFDVVPYFFGPTSYNYVVKNESGTTVSSGSHTTSTSASPNPKTVTVSQSGIYSLVLTSPSLPGVTIARTIFVGVKSNWTHIEKYTLAPNSYSLKRDATAPGTFSNAISLNTLPEGAAGWVKFVAAAPGSFPYNSNRNYMTFTTTSSTAVPGASDTYLEFHYELGMISTYPGIAGTPTGVRMTYKNAGGTPHSALIPIDAQMTVRFTASHILVSANDILVATLTRPSGILQLKANSNKTNQGFHSITTSFDCGSSFYMYAKLEKTLKGVNYPASSGMLRFYYEEEYTTSSFLNYKIYDRNNAVALSSSSSSLPKEYGDNRYDLDIAGLGQGTYLLEVTNEKNEKFYLRFSK